MQYINNNYLYIFIYSFNTISKVSYIIKIFCVQICIDGNLDLDNFGKKKKKKKKNIINLDDLENALPDTSSAMENGDGQEDAMDVSFTLSLMKIIISFNYLFILIGFVG
jgi:hypothetical protein